MQSSGRLVGAAAASINFEAAKAVQELEGDETGKGRSHSVLEG